MEINFANGSIICDESTGGNAVLHPIEKPTDTADKIIICRSCPLSAANCGVCDFMSNGEENPKFSFGPERFSGMEEMMRFIGERALCLRSLEEQQAIISATRAKASQSNSPFTIYK